MTKNAVIEVTNRGGAMSNARALARRLDAGEDLPEANYHLGFESAAQLFAELTPQRMRLLETLKATGPQSIYALAK